MSYSRINTRLIHEMTSRENGVARTKYLKVSLFLAVYSCANAVAQVEFLRVELGLEFVFRAECEN